MGPIEMKLCAVCNYKTLCHDCETKLTTKKRNKPEECDYEKVYVLLFADMVSRAVDLQLLQERTSESVLMAFIRMTSTRSIPTLVLSDNAKEFLATSTSLQQVK